MPPEGQRKRSATAFRLDPDIQDRARRTAEEWDWSLNTLINRALRHYLDNMTPHAEMRWLRGEPSSDNATSSDITEAGQ